MSSIKESPVAADRRAFQQEGSTAGVQRVDCYYPSKRGSPPVIKQATPVVGENAPLRLRDRFSSAHWAWLCADAFVSKRHEVLRDLSLEECVALRRFKGDMLEGPFIHMNRALHCGDVPSQALLKAEEPFPTLFAQALNKLPCEPLGTFYRLCQGTYQVGRLELTGHTTAYRSFADMYDRGTSLRPRPVLLQITGAGARSTAPFSSDDDVIFPAGTILQIDGIERNQSIAIRDGDFDSRCRPVDVVRATVVTA